MTFQNYCHSSKINHFNVSSYFLVLAWILLNNAIQPSYSLRCEIARVNCALRAGCGFSLQSYMTECADLISGRTNHCHPRCERALIGLISSDEGKDLINCDCEGSPFCEQSKKRIEVCRQSVYTAIAKDTIVSCNTARWICISDQLCKTALEYYHLYCRSLFHGHKCTHRCNNSLSILDRQDKAAKLRTCYCDGSEDFPCHRVKYNTERFCYGRHVTNPFSDESNNEILPMDHPDYHYKSTALHRFFSTSQSKSNYQFFEIFVIILSASIFDWIVWPSLIPR